MLNAKEARTVADSKHRGSVNGVALHNVLKTELARATEAGLMSASVVVPPSTGVHTLQGVVVSLKKAGYTVKTALEKGTLAPGVYVGPKTTLTLFW